MDTLKVLICTDNPRIQEKIEHILAQLEHTVIGVEQNPKDLDYSVHADNPDLVLISLEQPPKKIRDIVSAMQQTHPTPVLMVAEQASEALFLEPGSYATSWILDQPIELPALAQAINIALVRHRDYLAIKKAKENVHQTIREFIHRVKNDLATLSSLMHLQADRTADPEISKSLIENADRIRVVATLYDIIRGTDCTNNLRLDEYLELLFSKLTQGVSGEDRFLFDISTDYIISDAATAINCGFIMNELVTNALKHASSGQDKDILVRVTVKKIADSDAVEFCVHDNGAGLPVEIDPATASTFGFLLTSFIVHQLKGVMEVSRTGGTRFRFRFKAP